MDRYEYQPVPVEQLADYLNTSEGHEFTFHPPTLIRNAICELYAIKTGEPVPTFDQWLKSSGQKPLGWVKEAMREAYDACRAAALPGETS